MLLPWLPLIIFSGLWSLAASQVTLAPARKPAQKRKP